MALNLPKPFFALAPMDDVTDTVFRQIIAGCAPPDLFFTEFVNVDGLQSPGREKLLPKLRFSAKEKPIFAQLWGKVPGHYYKTAKELVGMGFYGVDINFGCPVKAVIKNGCGAAMINNRELAEEIIRATREAVGNDFPVSVKTRLGLNEIDFSWHEFLLKQKLNMLTIHGRTAKQMSKVPADWNAIGKIREMRDKLSPSTVIVGNGDVMTRAQGSKLVAEYSLDGIMIGRGVFSDPFVFSEFSPWLTMSKEEKIALYKKHVQLFAKTWSFSPETQASYLDGTQGLGEQRSESYKEYEERVAEPITQRSAKSTGGVASSARQQVGTVRSLRTLNKFCKIYINGFDGAKELRERLMKASSTKEILNILK